MSSCNCIFVLEVFVCVVDEQILKDGMQHVGKLICSNLGARMDSEPKRWRIVGLHLDSGHCFFPSFYTCFSRLHIILMCMELALCYLISMIL